MQETLLGKQDQMLDKLENVRVDVVDEIRSSTESLISEMKNAGEWNAADLRDSHTDLKSYLDEKLGRMEDDISRIKAPGTACEFTLEYTLSRKSSS